MSDQNAIQQLSNQINQITQSLDGTIAQINSLNRKVEDNSKKLMENLTAVNENMRLIIEVIKKGRSGTRDTLKEVQSNIRGALDTMVKKSSFETLLQDEYKAVKKLKDINKDVSKNVYMQELLAIINSLREITGRAMIIKMEKKKSSQLF
ncbi:MAG: hypothetical protein ACTSVU_00670 [Promethearchaeota archaeon]